MVSLAYSIQTINDENIDGLLWASHPRIDVDGPRLVPLDIVAVWQHRVRFGLLQDAAGYDSETTAIRLKDFLVFFFFVYKDAKAPHG